MQQFTFYPNNKNQNLLRALKDVCENKIISTIPAQNNCLQVVINCADTHEFAELMIAVGVRQMKDSKRLYTIKELEESGELPTC